MSEQITIGDEIPFPRLPTDDESLYPPRCRIDCRKTHMGYEERHVWIWDDRTIEEDWIPSPRPGASKRAPSASTEPKS